MRESRFISKRSRSIVSPASMDMAQRARELRAAGEDIVDFSIGEPDFDTPVFIQNAAKRALDEGYTHYAPSRGYPELLDAIAKRIGDTSGCKPDPKQQILVTPGAKQALVTCLMAALDDGDEVLLPSPCWLSYAEIVKMAGGVPIFVEGQNESQFIPDIEAIEENVASNSKAIIINTPCNPTGAVWPAERMAQIFELARIRDILIISDEIYEGIVYEKSNFTSFASIDRKLERTVIVNGWSKSFAMTGWRIGYMAGPESFIQAAYPLHQNSATSVNAFVQQGALAALSCSQNDISDMLSEYRARRDLLLEGLKDIEGLSVLPVDGTFYAFVDFRSLGMNSVEIAQVLLEKANVVTTPGSAYGPGGEGYLRFSFAVSRKQIERGLERIRKVMSLGDRLCQASLQNNLYAPILS